MRQINSKQNHIKNHLKGGDLHDVQLKDKSLSQKLPPKDRPLDKLNTFTNWKLPTLSKSIALVAMLLFAHTNTLAADQQNAKATQVETQAVPAQTLAAINNHAQKVVAFYQQDNPQFGLNEASIQALEQAAVLYTAMPRSQADTTQFIQRYGSFYGQALIQLYGGKWIYINGGLGIQGKHGTFAYPFATIINRLTKKVPNSIYKDAMLYKQINSMSEAQFKQALLSK